MIASFLYLALSLLLLVPTLKLLLPGLGRGLVSAALSFMAMVLLLFLPQLILMGMATTLVFAHFGAMDALPGQIGLGVHLLCWAGLVGHMWRMHYALPMLDGLPVPDDAHPFCEGLTEEEVKALKPGQVSWRPSLTLRIPEMRQVDVLEGVIYREVDGVRLRLDVYREREKNAVRPAVVYIHGGGWISGTRRQARFMCHQLAMAGWVVFAVSYRFAPRFPLPAAITDVKAAVAWIREHAHEYGAMGDRIIAIGGSAGGHLTAMLALSPNQPRFQPGFESTDTRVQGAVVFYGVPDFVGAFEEKNNKGLAILLEQLVFKKRYRDDPELYRASQPSSYITPDSPPVLLVHGVNDFMVPIRESRSFYQKLKSAGARAVHLIEVPLSPHAFDLSPSPLQQRTIRLILRFMETLRTSPLSLEAPTERASCPAAEVLPAAVEVPMPPGRGAEREPSGLR